MIALTVLVVFVLMSATVLFIARRVKQRKQMQFDESILLLVNHTDDEADYMDMNMSDKDTNNKDNDCDDCDSDSDDHIRMKEPTRTVVEQSF